MRCSAVLVVLAAMSTSAAAPPTLTQLFPAGGQRGQTVAVSAGGTFSTWPMKAWCDSKSITITPAKEAGKFSFAIAADVIPGTYWVRLYNPEGASELRPFIVGNLPEVLEQEPNDDYRKPQQLASVQAIVNGKLERAGDVDSYAVRLQKGQTLVASLEAHRTLRSPMDGVLQVVNVDGFVLAQNDDFYEIDPHIVFTAARDSTYIVRVFAFPSTPDSSIQFAGNDRMIYRLTLTTAGFADHAWPLAVTRNSNAMVSMAGWNIPEAAKTLAPQPVNDATTAIFHPVMANAATLRLEPHSTITSSATTGRTQPQPVELPTTISGKLDHAGGVAVFQFAAKKGQRLSFQIESRSLLFPLDPVLRLTDAAGKQLAEAQATKLNTDPTLTFNVTQEGRYRFEVRDLHGDGGPRFVYRLRAVFAEPDFDLSVATDRFALAPGKLLTVPVTIERRNGFAEEVAIDLEGLPPGVNATLEPTKVPPVAKSAVLKLFAAKESAFSGPLRIVGRSNKHSPRSARANGAAPEWTTDRLWLTVVP